MRGAVKTVLTETQEAIKNVFNSGNAGKFVRLYFGHSGGDVLTAGVYFVQSTDYKKGAGVADTFLILENELGDMWTLGWREALDTANSGKNPVVVRAEVLTDTKAIAEFYAADQHNPVAKQVRDAVEDFKMVATTVATSGDPSDEPSDSDIILTSEPEHQSDDNTAKHEMILGCNADDSSAGFMYF